MGRPAGMNVPNSDALSEAGNAPPSTSVAAPEKLDLASTKASEADVGSALRQAFRATVEEQVPDTMLDLLRRLS